MWAFPPSLTLSPPESLAFHFTVTQWTGVFSLCAVVSHWPSCRGRWCFSEEHRGNERCWSVCWCSGLRSTQFLCFQGCHTFAPLWLTAGDSLYPQLGERALMWGPKCTDDYICEWMYVCQSVFLGEAPLWSLRPWFILVPVVQLFELVTLPTTNELQPCAGPLHPSASRGL